MPLPKSLPSTDRAAISLVISELRKAGYEPWQIFDPDEGSWVNFEGSASIMRMILDLDDAEVMFQNTRKGNAFWIRFVMGNEPYEVVCDHSYKDEDEVGYDAYQALNNLTNRWIDIESEAL